MAYIEENMKLRRSREQQSAGTSAEAGTGSTSEVAAGPSTGAQPAANAQDDLFDNLDPRYKVERKLGEEGSVTNSLSMLTAIPEVDLGIKCVTQPSLLYSFG
jgi:Hepatocellular carcinoma-associated antigen 59